MQFIASTIVTERRPSGGREQAGGGWEVIQRLFIARTPSAGRRNDVSLAGGAVTDMLDLIWTYQDPFDDPI